MSHEKSGDAQAIRFRVDPAPFSIVEFPLAAHKLVLNHLVAKIDECQDEDPPTGSPLARFLSVTWADASISIVAPANVAAAQLQTIQDQLTASPELNAAIKHSPGWSRIEIVGPLPLEMVGVMSLAAGQFAREGISVFPVATYKTDHLFVNASAVRQAAQGLKQIGWVEVSCNEVL